jgi:ABC-type multidrug transport system fused ATPase/permease subunit
MSVEIIQANLLRKFLNYDQASRHVVSASDLTMAISRDAPELVKGGLLPIFIIVQRVGLLLILLSLAIRQSRRVDLSIWYVFSLFTAFPLLVITFLGWRQPGTTMRRHKLFCCETLIVRFLQQTNDFFRLIADYGQKYMISTEFGIKVADCNKAFTDSGMWETTNLWFAPFVTTLLSSLFTLLTFRSVMDGGPIGEFMTGIAIWKSIGDVYEVIYESLLEIQAALTDLQLIVYYMNLATDVPERMALLNGLLEIEREKWSTARTSTYGLKANGFKDGHFQYAVDHVDIEGCNLSFSYPSFTGGGSSVLDDTSFSVPQGNLVAVTGPRGGGKATLLHLLGGVLHPTTQWSEGNSRPALFIPPHLRVLHVSHQPQVLTEKNLFENLCFGPSDGEDEDPMRVIRICQRLGIGQQSLSIVRSSSQQNVSAPSVPLEKGRANSKEPSSKLDGLEDNFEQVHLDALEIVSYTDMSLIHIARALVMNPEVLIIHKPLAHFDDIHSHAVLEYLREFVDQRGVEKPAEGRDMRRPRTCVYSVETTGDSNSADLTLYVGAGKVEEVRMKNFGS